MTPPASDTIFRLPTGESLARIHGMVNVWLQRVADVALQPMTVLAATLWLMNASWMTIALVVMVAGGAQALGSMVMPYALMRVTDTRLFLLFVALIHAIAAILLAMLGWQAGSFGTRNFVVLFSVATIFYFVSAGANVLRNPRSTMANVDQTSEPFTRQFIGAAAAFIAGFAVLRTLGDRGLGFPTSIGWVIALGGIASIASVWFQITAPMRPNDMRQKPLVASRQDVVRALESSRLRRFLAVRLIIGLASLADAFLVIYGLSHLGLDLTMVGMVVLAIVAAQVLGGVSWTFFRELRGRQRSIQGAAVLRLIALALASAIPFVVDSSWYRDRFTGTGPAAFMFMIVYFLIGLSNATLLRNEHVYALKLLPDYHLYPASNLLLQVIALLTALLPLVAAAMLAVISLETLVLIATGLAFVALLATATLVERRPKPRSRLRPSPRGGPKPVRRNVRSSRSL